MAIQSNLHKGHEENTASDVVKRIEKLRWLGMEEAAELEIAVLCQLHTTTNVAIGPIDTD